MSQAVRNRRSLGRAQAGPSRPTTTVNPIRQPTHQEALELQEREREARQRRQKRRLDELERTNYRDGPVGHSLGNDRDSAQLAAVFAARRQDDTPDDLVLATSTGGSKDDKRRANANVKRILATRKAFNTLLDEAMAKPGVKDRPNYLTAAAAPSRYPTRHVCTVCGYWGKVACSRCGERYCGLKCQEAHNETRCQKPIR